MAEAKRRYDVSQRRETANAKRHAVIRAAQNLFEENGFRATTLAAVAERAEVSVKTLYNSFGSKADLAKAVFELVIAGDEESVRVVEQSRQLRMRDEPDARRKIEIFVEGLAERHRRAAKVIILIRDGRHVDDSLTPVWEQLSREALVGATIVGRNWLESGGLRSGLTIDEVRDVLSNYLRIDHYEWLVIKQGWTDEHYRNWLTRTLISALTD